MVSFNWYRTHVNGKHVSSIIDFVDAQSNTSLHVGLCWNSSSAAVICLMYLCAVLCAGVVCALLCVVFGLVSITLMLSVVLTHLLSSVHQQQETSVIECAIMYKEFSKRSSKECEGFTCTDVHTCI